MKKLNPPIKLDHNQYLIDIIDSKREGDIKIELGKKKASVLIRYTEYVKQFNLKDLLPVKDSAFEGGDASLVSCYLSGGKKIAEIKKAIKDLQDKFGNEKCMYCQIKDPDSFDHYLPKDLYPEFSSLAINLIPCCVTCNKKKDKYWKELGQVGIINFYLNSIPIVQFLYADITFSNSDYQTPIVKFVLDNKQGIDKATFKIIEKHYKRLDLAARYKDKVNSVISELKRILNSYGKDLTTAKKIGATADYASQLKIDYGINYWKAILLDELSKKTIFYTHNKI
jgi:hypothetical protein